MNAAQAVVGLLIFLLVVLGGYVGFRFLSYQLDQRWPDKVEVAPAPPPEAMQYVPEPAPPLAWWDELEALRSQFGTLQIRVNGQLSTAENQLKLARASEERARKMQSADNGSAPALPVMLPGGWENVDEPAPVGQTHDLTSALLNKRRRA